MPNKMEPFSRQVAIQGVLENKKKNDDLVENLTMTAVYGLSSPIVFRCRNPTKQTTVASA